TFECGHDDFRTECCLRKRYGNMTIQIMLAALEELVFLHHQHDVKIALLTSGSTGVAFCADAQLIAGIDPGRNFHLQAAFPNHASVTPAALAGILDDLSGAAACGTRSRNAEKTLLEANLSVAIACRACYRSRSALAAAAVAFGAGFVTGVLN